MNENYVSEGIRRFITAPHKYGKDDDASGMIGYVQNMSFVDILSEVNAVASAAPETVLPLNLSSLGWQTGGVSELTHDLSRPFPVTTFRLYHFWVDVR
ncbi:MAG: hypothetical protein IMF07_03305 [Proteobacteria bacterium]|nr:hypothetical protein [Pseudomonadota bacterium]